ncbi:MAG: flavin reductase [Treponema sp.]|nr:flavin reductase [Treponema sp.]MBR0546092.1 flavin reductase [Treponema sp.]MDY4766907.1 flavin reductase [Treponema sp.]MEE1268135.1 flavin reductase [Treponema sp.]
MKINFGTQTFMYPMPVLIIASYGPDGTPDAMNAAWGGIHDTNQIGICLSPEHKTVKNILDRKAFSVSMADAAHVAACDYVGIVSGNKEPAKVQKAGFTVTKSEIVDAPVINELPMALECKLVSYDENSGYMVADIVNVCADESVLTDGKIDPSKLNPITYDPVNHTYIKLGEVVGHAFQDGKSLK